ncbi:MAG TPA: response regulator transcription factor [Chloroflexota bacterium]|nr:response regulator transcription factor [Chloroflexota bacterium]
MARVLLVEDERKLAELIRLQLEGAGHSVSVAVDGLAALATFADQAADLVILDWMLPGLDGLEVCRRIRAESIVPVLMLTARSEELDRVLGLEVGADDYLTKPFSMPELLARTRALLRRVELMTGGRRTAETGNDGVLELGRLRVDPAGRSVEVDGDTVDLTPKEFELLRMLAEQPGRAYSREYLLRRIWGPEYVGFDRTVDSTVTRLRRKLGALGDRIATVWGVGYKLLP